jgi:UDP-glucose 4-epimerase
MKTLVTGSSAQLGAVTVKLLKKHHYNVYGIDIMASSDTDQLVDISHKIV